MVQTHLPANFIFAGRTILRDWCSVEVHSVCVYQSSWTCVLVRRSLRWKVSNHNKFIRSYLHFWLIYFCCHTCKPDLLYISNSTVQRWFTTAPGAPTTHWYQIRCVLLQPIHVMAGQEITGRLHLVAHSAQSYTINLTLSGQFWLSLHLSFWIILAYFLLCFKLTS